VVTQVKLGTLARQIAKISERNGPVLLAGEFGTGKKRVAESIRQNARRAEADQDAILSAMRYANYNVTRAARVLHISRATLYSLIDKYNLRFVSSQGKSSRDRESSATSLIF